MLIFEADSAEHDAQQEADVKEDNAEDSEDDGRAVGSPGGGDDGLFGVGRRVEDGEGFAGLKGGFAGIVASHEDLDELSGLGAEAQARNIEDAAEWVLVGDVFRDGGEGALLGAGEGEGVQREGSGDEHERSAEPGERGCHAGREAGEGSVVPAQESHRVSLRCTWDLESCTSNLT